MQIELYKSALCPRCAYTIHILKRLQDEFDDIEVISYDLVTDFKVFKDSRVTMIPSIKYGEQIKSWVLPKASEIREFVLKCRHSNESSATQTA